MLPLVTILLPAYNCQNYIQQTIDSILHQTYQNFELLIINDGSTDNTTNIINNYSDDRIKHIINETNKGLIYSLNKGLEIAKGKYIARIDADDICLPTRIEKQVNWLNKNTNTAIIATTIQFINEHNQPTGNWSLDLRTITSNQIYKAMLWECCIAHPSVMMRTEIIKNYKYNQKQKHTEDYDLWLQLLADKKIIEKINEPLLLYRIHRQSVTGSIHRKKNPFFTNANTKFHFLVNRLRAIKWSLFETKLLFTILIHLGMGIGKEIKKSMKN